MSSQIKKQTKYSQDDGSADLLIGLVGRGIQQSRTPRMHMAEGAAQGHRILYQILDADAFPRGEAPLEKIVDAAELCGFAGLNVTFPYKIDVMNFLDELSPNARAIGAVNTVVFHNGRRIGHNTDKWGFEEGFRRNLPGAKMGHVLQIGAGGAGVAVAHALLSLGAARLTITDTNPARAAALVTQLSQNAGAAQVDAIGLDQIPEIAPTGVVNATPMGMAKLPGSAYPVELLHPDLWVADIVYFPLETELLAAARAAGCRVLLGSGMAVYQAVRAYELFTGRKPDPMRMKATFDSFIS